MRVLKVVVSVAALQGGKALLFPPYERNSQFSSDSAQILRACHVGSLLLKYIGGFPIKPTVFEETGLGLRAVAERRILAIKTQVWKAIS